MVLERGWGLTHKSCSALRAMSSSTITILRPMAVSKSATVFHYAMALLSSRACSQQGLSPPAQEVAATFTTPLSHECNSYTWIRGGDYEVMPSKLEGTSICTAHV